MPVQYITGIPPRKRAEILRDFCAGMAPAEICKKHHIGVNALARLRASDSLDEEKKKFEEMVKSAEMAAAVKAESEVAAVLAESKVYQTARQQLEELYNEAIVMFREQVNKRKNPLRPKSYEGTLSAILKMADVISRMKEDGTQADRLVEIRITGSDPRQLPVTDVKLLESESIPEAETVPETTPPAQV